MSTFSPDRRNLICTIFSGLCLVAGVVLFAFDKTTGGSFFSAAGVALIFIANAEKFESFKAGSVEAKTRDLRIATGNAETTLQKLELTQQEVAKISHLLGEQKAAAIETMEALNKELADIKMTATNAQAMAALNFVSN